MSGTGSAGMARGSRVDGSPPLPKSSSGSSHSAAGGAAGGWRHSERSYAQKSRIQDESNRGGAGGGGARAAGMRTKPPNSDAASASLRKEMVGLRQSDMSLLCQSYSLYESIQEYKGACQAASSSDCTYASENGFFDDEEDFQEQGSSQDGQHHGSPRDQSPLTHLSSSDWISESI